VENDAKLPPRCSAIKAAKLWRIAHRRRQLAGQPSAVFYIVIETGATCRYKSDVNE
jgi:hypothetical protein